MKTVFLQQGGGELLIFFNGWSRDASDVSRLTAPFAVLEVHDYTDLDPSELLDRIRPYPRLHLAAWSLGVWAAACVFGPLDLHFESTLALNGTLYPVHPEYGIAPEIFDGTISNWGESAARERFLRRMAGSAAAAQTLPEPDRTPEGQQSELAAIRKAAGERQLPRNLYQRAVIGLRDRIIPAQAQQNYWTREPQTVVRTVGLPHYPLAGLTCWEEVLRLGNA